MKGDNIAARLHRFGADVVRLCRSLPDEPEPNCSGNAFHCEPVRKRYTMPVRIVRFGIGGRPRRGPGGHEGSSGST
jgi:hypothetical protein